MLAARGRRVAQEEVRRHLRGDAVHQGARGDPTLTLTLSLTRTPTLLTLTTDPNPDPDPSPYSLLHLGARGDPQVQEPEEAGGEEPGARARHARGAARHRQQAKGGASGGERDERPAQGAHRRAQPGDRRRHRQAARAAEDLLRPQPHPGRERHAADQVRRGTHRLRREEAAADRRLQERAG